MKVKRLIEQLQKCDPKSEVIVLCCDDNPINGDGVDINRVFEIAFVDGDIKSAYIDCTAD